MDIQVGNICKFEDFEPIATRKPSYKIGLVTDVTGNIIQYDVLLDIFAGQVWTGSSPAMMQAPKPGVMTYDWLTRIQVLS